MRLAEALDTPTGVSLDVLRDSAELLRRVDRKYVLPTAAASDLVQRIAADSQVLEIGDARSFEYRTVYFDLPELPCYLATARRRRKRFKVRLRRYVGSGLTFLEVKTRGRRGVTQKDRVEVSAELMETDRLPTWAAQYAQEIIHMRLGETSSLQGLTAELYTSYRRSTLLLPSSERLTIDENLTVNHPGAPGVQLASQVVVETKSAGHRSCLGTLLWRSGQRPARISKYATGMALLDPTLPHNRWVHTMNRLNLQSAPNKEKSLI